MMIVMPIVTERNESQPPDVHAVIIIFEIFVAQYTFVTKQINHERDLLNEQSRQSTDQSHFPTKENPNYASGAKANGCIREMAGVPVVTALQQPVHGIIDQVRRLNFRVEMLRISGSENPSHVSLVIAEAGAMRIERSIYIAMMSAMNSRPPDRRTHERHITSGDKEILDRLWASEAAMPQQPVVAYRDP